MSRKNYIHNRNPFFTPPDNKIKKSTFVCYAMKKASEIDVARSNLNCTLVPIDPKTGTVLPRFRRLNAHRASAMRAIVLAMLYHFDIHSNLVNASIEELADECGLSTFSNSGNKSITRVSRLINEFLEPMGFVKCKKKIRNASNHYISKQIFLTPMFFMLLNISQSTINSYLRKSKKLSSTMRKKKLFISFSDIKIISELDEKSAKNKLLNVLINYYTAHELTKIGPQGLRKKIDIEYNNLCKLYKKK
ncbi:MAG: replication protein RepA (plasmid) [Buchnera aphidicola (Pentalonia nigronervosa)]|uniref:Replication protein RepA n=1 Tax=Buchnera aphidicola (Pentalonia nigronervosa) TaxID=1309793 RepID=A0A7H1B063_9GAMM|nr:MAG: replication protein RepA [Buchnera aphidicola (Pentalonia nigronervosa)]